MSPFRFPSAVAAAAFFVATLAAASAEQSYQVSGSDTFTTGEHELRSEITYSGRQTLSETRSGRTTHYRASVRYVKSDQGAQAPTTGSFEATLTPLGEQRDEVNHDPDYLTVLNQPFSVKLDPATIAEVARLRGPVPFDFPSPIIGATLHGSLRRTGDALVGGERALGVAFEATGPMKGPIPDHPAIVLNGNMKMTGTAYYMYRSALLLALDATLTIAGNVVETGKNAPVTIVYRRSMKAEGPAQLNTAANSLRAGK